MAYFTGKNNFASGDIVTHTSLNDITNNLRLDTSSFSSTFSLNAGVVSITAGGITDSLIETSTSASTGISGSKIRDDAITTAKLPDSTSASDGVTYAKMQYVTYGSVGKVLGRKTASNGIIEELDIDNNISGVSSNDDTIPSAKAVKTYVDSNPGLLPSTVSASTKYVQLPNGLIMKFGEEAPADATDTQTTITFDSTVAFDTVPISVQLTGLKNDDVVFTDSLSLKSVSTTQAVVNHPAAIGKNYYTAIGE
jgi:hypothetical protein